MHRENDPALDIRNLSYRYGRDAALRHASLVLPAGRIYGLLGKNGAGKTTLLNLISAAMPTQKGSIQVFGEKPFENADALRRVCFVREKNMYPAGAQVRHVLSAARAAYPHWDGEFALRLAEMFHLDTGKRCRQLSRGMESSLGLVIALASRSEVTMLDEPSLGLDAFARERFYEACREDMLAHPRTLILSTHLIDEGAELFDDVIIMDNGQILLHENRKALLDRYAVLVGDTSLSRHGRVLHRSLTAENEPMLAVEKGAHFEGGAAQVKELSLQKLFVYLTEGGEQ